MRTGSLFSGYGGLDLGVRAVVDGDLAWVCDNDPAATKVLAHHNPEVPNLGDITAVDWHQVAPVDVLTGGFPCQDVSTAGRRAGLKPGTRSGLWSHMAHAIHELRPRLVVAENVRGLLSAKAHSDVEPCPWCVGDDRDHLLRALGAVLGDLAVLGYDAAWCGLRAADVGAPHGRYRIFVAAVPNAHGPTGDQRRITAPGQAESRWPRANTRGRDRAPAADTGCDTWAEDNADIAATAGSRRASSDANVSGRGPRKSPDGQRQTDVDWGGYKPAIRRWEHTLGRPAPEPTQPGRRGGQQLSAAFTEWLMGLPAGHVTAVPGLTRSDQLRLLGNGVVPQQAAAAITWLYEQIRAEQEGAA